MTPKETAFLIVYSFTWNKLVPLIIQKYCAKKTLEFILKIDGLNEIKSHYKAHSQRQFYQEVLEEIEKM